MNLKPMANAITSRVGRQLLVASKYSPKILFVAGVAGMIGTVVLASRATLKLNEVLDEHEENKDKAQRAFDNQSLDYSESDHRRDLIILHTKLTTRLAKLYAPAAVLGIASIAALTGSHVVLNRRYLGVTAAYAALEKGFDAYRRRVVEQYGDEKDFELRHGLVDKEVFVDDEQGGRTQVVKGLADKDVSIYAVFFDERSTSWNKEWGYNQVFLKCQQQYANDRLKAQGHLLLNDVYEMLGLPRTPAGCVVGWLWSNCEGDGGDNYIDFGIFRNNQYMGTEFVKGNERSVLLDFNVDGVIWDKI